MIANRVHDVSNHPMSCYVYLLTIFVSWLISHISHAHYYCAHLTMKKAMHHPLLYNLVNTGPYFMTSLESLSE